MEGEGWMDYWLGGIWDVTLSFFCIVSFGCATPISMTEGPKLKDTQNGPLKVYIKDEERDTRGRVMY